MGTDVDARERCDTGQDVSGSRPCERGPVDEIRRPRAKPAEDILKLKQSEDVGGCCASFRVRTQLCSSVSMATVTLKSCIHSLRAQFFWSASIRN